MNHFKVALSLLIYLSALINGFLLLLLPLSCIRSIYVHLLCGTLLLITHFLSYYYVHQPDGYNSTNGINVIEKMASTVQSADSSNHMSLLAVYVLVTIIASVLLRIIRRPIPPIFVCYYLPVVARIVDFPAESIEVKRFTFY